MLFFSLLISFQWHWNQLQKDLLKSPDMCSLCWVVLTCLSGPPWLQDTDLSGFKLDKGSYLIMPRATHSPFLCSKAKFDSSFQLLFLDKVLSGPHIIPAFVFHSDPNYLLDMMTIGYGCLSAVGVSLEDLKLFWMRTMNKIISHPLLLTPSTHRLS